MKKRGLKNYSFWKSTNNSHNNTYLYIKSIEPIPEGFSVTGYELISTPFQFTEYDRTWRNDDNSIQWFLENFRETDWEDFKKEARLDLENLFDSEDFEFRKSVYQGLDDMLKCFKKYEQKTFRHKKDKGYYICFLKAEQDDNWVDKVSLKLLSANTNENYIGRMDEFYSFHEFNETYKKCPKAEWLDALYKITQVLIEESSQETK